MNTTPTWIRFAGGTEALAGNAETAYPTGAYQFDRYLPLSHLSAFRGPSDMTGRTGGL